MVAVYYIPQEEETVHRKGSIANSFKRKSLYDLEQEEEVTYRLKKKKREIRMMYGTSYPWKDLA